MPNFLTASRMVRRESDSLTAERVFKATRQRACRLMGGSSLSVLRQWFVLVGMGFISLADSG